MTITDLFSKRRKRAASAGKPVLYTYDTFPKEFRVQVVHIWRTAIGPWFETGEWSSGPYASNGFWIAIHDLIARELGVPALAKGSNPFDRCITFLEQGDADGVLDIIELSFRILDRAVRQLNDYQREQTRITQDVDEAIAELNHRFREHQIGYQYADGDLIRVDSQYIHTTAVEPALTLLHDAGFTGPNAEFLSGHDHYRKGSYKEAIADALKALESTLKVICDARRWPYVTTATSKTLLDIVFAQHLIPKALQSEFTALRATLESGVPTVRNRLAGHGQGATAVEVPDYLAAYVMHLAAANIVLLVEAHRAKP